MTNNVFGRSGTMVKTANLARAMLRKPKQKKSKDSLGLLSQIARSIQGLQ